MECFNCGEKETKNISEPWINAYHCKKCNHIYIKFYQDLMSGCLVESTEQWFKSLEDYENNKPYKEKDNLR